MTLIFTLLAFLLLVYAGGTVVYLLVQLAAAAMAKRGLYLNYGRLPAVSTRPSIVVIIPAHDEELVIAHTLESLRDQDYDDERYEIVMVADNCSDRTADVARNHGVRVLERIEPDKRGKGYALDWAIALLIAEENPADAFVIIDADTAAAPDFLRIMASRLVTEADARGYCALQGRYGVLNSKASWRSALMSSAFDLFNHVRPLGRDWLGLSVGLKGNGMAFSRALLEKAHWSGSSITEDIDFALDLCRTHNVRVAYVAEARVAAQMPATAAQASSQRSRWEAGRSRLLRERGPSLLWEAVRTRNLLLFESAVDLLMPPLAELSILLVVWAALIACGIQIHALTHPHAWMAAVAAGSIGLFLYVLGGLAVADASREAYCALLFAPFYAVWKLRLQMGRRSRKSDPPVFVWVRTQRTPIRPVDNTDPQIGPVPPVSASRGNLAVVPVKDSE